MINLIDNMINQAKLKRQTAKDDLELSAQDETTDHQRKWPRSSPMKNGSTERRYTAQTKIGEILQAWSKWARTGSWWSKLLRV